MGSLFRPLIGRLRGNLASSRFYRDRRGLGAVEFALIVPIIITLYLGAVEFGHALTLDRRVTAIASATADLVAQVEQVNDADIADIFAASSSIIIPYSQTPLSIILTSVVADANGNTTVDWSEAQNGTPYTAGGAFTLPAGLVQPFASVIVAEVSYIYNPTVGQFLTGGVTLTETFYLKPRRSLTVQKL